MNKLDAAILKAKARVDELDERYHDAEGVDQLIEVCKDLILALELVAERLST